MPVRDLPHVPMPRLSLFAMQLIRTSHVRQLQKGRNANAVLSASEKLTTAGPTCVPVTPSGTIMEHQHLTADVFVQ